MNNPFLTKKDSLVEAVQSAMQDGELRRQAEALVNEEFGVYSRKAVVREQLAAYDARLEEAYKCMKEGNKENKEKKRDVEASTGAAYKKMGFDGRGSKGRHPENKRHDDIGLGRKVMKFGEEAKKLADKDYDKDGKIESPKDEVWGSRFRAAKMAGKMEEEQIDEISKALALKAMKKSDERGEEEYDRDMTADRLSDPKTHWDRAKRLRGHMKRKFGNKTIKTGGTDNLSPKSYEQGGGERRRADKLTKGPRAGKISARHRDKLKDNIKYSLGKHKKPNLPEEAQIDEISKGLAGRYKDKAHASYTYSAGKRSDDEFVSGPGKKMTDASGKPKFKERSKEAQKADDKTIQKRLKGLGMAHKRLSKEEVDYSAPDRAAVTRDNKPSTPAQTNAATSGPSAADKAALASKISTMKEAVYSAKAARAGKDIGKPGKMFSKIAKKAGEKYGSEERGKKVAGAILKRIRAKHMREE